MEDIMILLENGTWVPAYEYQKLAYVSMTFTEIPFRCNSNGYNFIIRREGDIYNGPIYLVRENGTKGHMADMSQIKELKVNDYGPNWFIVPDTIKLAYLQFIETNDSNKNYNIMGTEVIFIRVQNGSIEYKIGETKTRISHNPKYMSDYSAYIRRIIDFVEPMEDVPELPQGIDIIATNDDDKQCAICYTTMMNIQFVPCNHTYTCSDCYTKMIDKKHCPYCKQKINTIEKFNL